MSSGNEPDGCYILSDRETSDNPEHGTGSLDLEENSACEELGNTPTKNNKADITIDDITPRKQAKFQSPKGKNKFAGGREIHKHGRKVYANKSVYLVRSTPVSVGRQDQQSVGSNPCTKCRFKCSTKVNEDERIEIFNGYWNLNSYERQRDFIASSVLVRDYKGTPSKKRKQVARTFTFDVNGRSVRICKTFFITTLGIGRKTVDTSLGKKNRKNISPIKDKRGKHQPHNKTPTQDRDIVQQHNESFPTMESHYTRKDSNKQYLSCDIHSKNV